jgi:hypothetical protein
MSTDISLVVWSGPRAAAAYAYSENWSNASVVMAKEAGCDLRGLNGHPATEVTVPAVAAVQALTFDRSRFEALNSKVDWDLIEQAREHLVALAVESERHQFAVLRVES